MGDMGLGQNQGNGAETREGKMEGVELLQVDKGNFLNLGVHCPTRRNWAGKSTIISIILHRLKLQKSLQCQFLSKGNRKEKKQGKMFKMALRQG